MSQLYSIQSLEGPKTPAGFPSSTIATGINQAGDVAGAAYEDPEGIEGDSVAVIWPVFGSMVALPWGSNSNFQGLNGAPSAVAAGCEQSFTPSIPISSQGAIVSNLTPEIGLGRYCTGINTRGKICGCGDFGLGGAFIYDSVTKVVTTLGFNFAEAINEAGQVAGSNVLDYPVSSGMFYSNGVTTNLGPGTYAYGLNDQHQVVGVGDSMVTPAIWNVAQTPPLKTPINIPVSYGANPKGFAYGINNRHMVVGLVLAEGLPQGQAAFLYDQNAATFTDLNGVLLQTQSGWQLLEATGINDFGQIVGNGIFNGKLRAFLLSPVITPIRLPLFYEIFINLLGGGVQAGSSGWGYVNGRPIWVGPSGPVESSQFATDTAAAIRNEAMMGLAVDELAMNLANAASRQYLRRIVLEQVRSRIDELLAKVGAVSGPAASAPAGQKSGLGKSAADFLRRRHNMHRSKRPPGSK